MRLVGLRFWGKEEEEFRVTYSRRVKEGGTIFFPSSSRIPSSERKVQRKIPAEFRKVTPLSLFVAKKERGDFFAAVAAWDKVQFSRLL